MMIRPSRGLSNTTDPWFALDLNTAPGPDLLALGSVQAAVGNPADPSLPSLWRRFWAFWADP